MPSDQGVLADSVSAPPCWITNPPRYVMHLSLMHTYAKSRPCRCARGRPRPGGRRVYPASERTNRRPDARQHCNTLGTPPSRRSHRTGRTHERRRRRNSHRTASHSAPSAPFGEYGGSNACAAARCIRTLSRRELNDTHAVGLPALSTGALTQPTRMRQGRRTRPTIRYRLAARNGLDAG